MPESNLANYLTASQSHPDFGNIAISEWVGSLSPATCTCGNYIITYSAYIKNTSSVSTNVRCSPILVGGSYDTFQGNYINSGEEGWSSVTCDLRDTTRYTGTIYCYFQNGSSGSVPTSPNIKVRYVQVERNSVRTAWTLGQTTQTFEQNLIINHLTLAQYQSITPDPHQLYIIDDGLEYETVNNKVTSLSVEVTDDNYPSARAVYEAVVASQTASADSKEY